MKIEKNLLEKDIRRVGVVVNRIPTSKDYIKHGEYGRNTIWNRYGTWNKALLEIFGEVNSLAKEKVKNKECQKCHNIFKPKAPNQKYCSQSCAAKINNIKVPKRTKTKKCKECGDLISSQATYCSKCISIGKHLGGGLFLSQRTIQDVIYGKGSNRYGVIRKHAKLVAKEQPKICGVCQYNKHVEVCHIKSINSFPINTKIEEVNHISNLVLLCPNCHWEFDHGDLKIGRRGEA